VKARRLNPEAAAPTFVLVFESGDEAMEGLRSFATEQKLGAAHFSGIGAFRNVVLGYFDWEQKDYRPIRIDEQVEVVSLLGDVALEDGKPAVHAHVVVAGRDGAARGGHLLEAHVRPTLEVVVSETPAHLRKRYDPESGLALIAPDASDDTTRPVQGETSLPHVPDEESNVVGEQGQRLVEEEAATPRSSTEEGG
jgi:predicted DNA-binding protein with PD1-like motif